MPSRPPLYRPPGWKPTPAKRPQVQESFYGTGEWVRLRKACWERDGHRCTDPDCRTPNRGHGGKLIAHHVKPRRKGGVDALWNLATLCPSCHEREHAGRRG